MTESWEQLLGYKVHASDLQSCVRDIVSGIEEAQESEEPGKGRWLACLNPHSYVAALDDEAFAQALSSADWLIPDGVGVVLASRILGGTIRERITGSDIFFGVNSELNQLRNCKVFFLGSTEEVLAEITRKMTIEFPYVAVAGTYSPPFKAKFSDGELDEMAVAINAAAPDVLWVGMTAPKQEKWIAEMIDRVDVRFAAAIGAVFDFYSGRVKRSHPIFQRFGLEWFPRLIQQPRRLWDRMFVSAPVFVFHVLRLRLGYKAGHSE